METKSKTEFTKLEQHKSNLRSNNLKHLMYFVLIMCTVPGWLAFAAGLKMAFASTLVMSPINLQSTILISSALTWIAIWANWLFTAENNNKEKERYKNSR